MLLNSATDQIINQTAGSSFGAVLDSGNVEFTAGGTGDFLATMAGGEAAFTVGNGFNVTDISTTGIDLTTQGPVDISGNLYSAAFTTTVDESSGGDWEQAVGGNYTLSATEAFFDMAANWTGLSSGTAVDCLALDSDNNVVLTTCGGSGSGAVLLSPGSGITQTVAQQAETSLNVNILNGDYYASQFGSSSTGIATAISNACTGIGCEVIAGINYANTELLPAIVREASGYGTGNYLAMPNWPGLTHVVDDRAGFHSQIFVAPTGSGSYYPSATGPQFIYGLYFNSAYDVTIPGNIIQQQTSINQSVFNGPGNQINGFGGVNLKSYDFGPVTTMISSDQGQHIGKQENMLVTGVGDAIGGAREMFVQCDGGASTYNDEGCHGGDFQVGEDLSVFKGTVSSTPSADATNFQSTVTAGAGTQGDGRYIIDTTSPQTGAWPTAYVSATVLALHLSPPMETFVGTSFTTGWVGMVCDPVVDTCNNGLDPTGKINSVAGGYAPGPITFTIVSNTSTPSLRTGYSTDTSGLPSTGIACVADSEYFETTTYTVESSSTILLNLRKPHFDGMTVGIGGQCQAGLEVTGGTYTIGSTKYRQVWPVVGNFNGTQLIVWDHDSQQGYSNAVLENNGTAYCSTDSSPASFSFSGTGPYTVTVFDSPETSTNPRFQGQTAIVTTGNSTYNGTVAITYTTLYHGGSWEPAYQYSLSSAPSGTAPTSGTIQFCNTSFNLYPALEVLSVLNPSTNTVDGYVSVAPNSIVGVSAFLHGDTVEEPHYFWQSDTYSGGLDQIAQMMPRAPLSDWQTAGLNYQNLMSGGYIGWSILNSTPQNKYLYFGNGSAASGTAPPPQSAYFANGLWIYDYEVHTAPAIGGAMMKLDAWQPSPYGTTDPLNSPVEIYQGPGANDKIYDNPYTGSFSFIEPIQIGSLGFPNTIYTPLFGTFAFSQDLGNSFTPDATIEAKYFQLYGATPPTNYLNLEFYGESSTGIGMQFPSADGGTHQTYQGGTLSVGGLRFYFPNTVDASKTAGISVNSTTGDMSLDGATAGDAGANVFLKNLTLNGGTTLTGQSSANSQIVTCPTGGTTTQYCDAAGAWVAPGTGNTTSTSLTTNSLPKANGANSLINSLFSDNGTTGSYSGGGGFSVTGGSPGISTPDILINGTTFTASGCSNSTLVGGATAGSFDSGTTGTCTVMITMGLSVTATNGFACFANDITTPADVIHETAFTTTTATLSGTTVTGDVINFACTGY